MYNTSLHHRSCNTIAVLGLLLLSMSNPLTAQQLTGSSTPFSIVPVATTGNQSGLATTSHGIAEAPLGSALTVELSSFTAFVHQNQIGLRWETMSEINNVGFEVERAVNTDSKTGFRWEKVGFIPGNWTSIVPRFYVFIDRNYAVSDSEPIVVMYRLKQLSSNGLFGYTAPLTVARGDQSEGTIDP